MKKRIFGIILITVGLYYLADIYYHFDIDIRYFFKFWPVILIYFGLKEIVKKQYIWGSILTILGVYFLLPALGIYLDLKEYIFPSLLILFGISLVFSKNKQRVKLKDGHKLLYYSTVFGGKDLRIDSNDLEILKLDVTFGGVDVDFRDMVLIKDLRVDINSQFGGIDLRLPKGYNLVVRSNSFFTGVETKYDSNSDSKFTIYVNNDSYFTGVEIR